jgi:hypothetical protein
MADRRLPDQVRVPVLLATQADHEKITGLDVGRRDRLDGILHKYQHAA